MGVREPLAGERAWTLAGAGTGWPGAFAPPEGVEVIVDQDGLDERGEVAVLWRDADGAERAGYVRAGDLVWTEDVLGEALGGPLWGPSLS